MGQGSDQVELTFRCLSRADAYHLVHVSKFLGDRVRVELVESGPAPREPVRLRTRRTKRSRFLESVVRCTDTAFRESA